MFPMDEYSWRKDYELNRLPEVMALVKQHRLLREAGLVQRSWLSCHVCRTLWRLGRMLVSAGQRLEQRYASPALKPT